MARPAGCRNGKICVIDISDGTERAVCRMCLSTTEYLSTPTRTACTLITGSPAVLVFPDTLIIVLYPI